MQKLFLGVCLLVPCASIAQTGAAPPLIDVNCQTLKISMGTTISTDIEVTPYWKNPAAFPNPPTSGSAGKDGQTYRIECPKLTVSDDGNVVEINAENYSSLIELIPSYSRKINLYGKDGYEYPNIKKGYWFKGYGIDIGELKLKSSIYDLKDGMDLTKNLMLLNNIPAKATLGYKVDGAALKPLIYDRKVYPYMSEFRKANVIDIYQKFNGESLVMERMTIDKANGILRMYRSYVFPEK